MSIACSRGRGGDAWRCMDGKWKWNIVANPSSTWLFGGKLHSRLSRHSLKFPRVINNWREISRHAISIIHFDHGEGRRRDDYYTIDHHIFSPSRSFIGIQNEGPLRRTRGPHGVIHISFSITSVLQWIFCHDTKTKPAAKGEGFHSPSRRGHGR